jgi:TP901 family phage tail tape measure protein
MAKGSNDLNMLLKAKVVKLKVELDAKGSNLPSQVNGISKMLADKPVKLKVKLDASVTEMNRQIGQITKLLQGAKSFKPIKIAVEIDVKGSASAIKKQLKEVHDVVADFNKKYGKQLQDMQQAQLKAKKIQQEASKPLNIKNTAGVQGFNNIKSYVSQLEQAEKQLRGKFSDGKGLFSSVQLKDAKGNLLGFVASLERANGVMEKIKYSWNKDKDQFQVIDRQTMTQTDKMVHKSMQSLVDLQRELGKTGKASRELSKEYNDLMKAGNNGTLTMDAVKAYQTKVNNAKEEVRVQKQLNDLKREEAKLLRDIKQSVKGTQGKFTNEAQELLKKTRNAGDAEAYKNIRVELGTLTNKVKDYNNNVKETEKVEKQRTTALRQLTKYLREQNDAHGVLSQANIKAVQQLAQRARSTKQMADVQKHLNAMYKQEQSNKDLESREKALRKLKTTMQDYGKALGKSGDTIEALFAQKSKGVKNSLVDIEREINYYTKRIQKVTDKAIQDNLNRAKGSIIDNVSHKQVRSLINEGDITKIKDYLATTQKLDIATAKVSTNAKGITRITTTLASTGKTAKQVTYEIDSLNNKLKYLGQQDVFNRNANLGIFEQMKIALARVPVWMGAMTAFYGTINGFRNMAHEILEVDKALTELKRVASSNLNIDTVFEGAIDLAQELGNNVHEVMQAVNDLSRTYGNFNERQLLAVAKTAVLMSNVSDLNAQEATETLIGTMNAFNIVAEDSIRIVDSLNEVDNDYAISTKQLATGLQKSASTAKTFGVELEESVGHITAIGAVTMESGNIIGNSLKTIYSRITTLDDAKSILDSVGVSVYKIGENGQKAIKPVNDILSDLGGKWKTLSDEQRQNIAVTVAGRYQLSRFLALMNNWSMSTQATRTALTAQGSAMRENAKYMDSFEARINKLKNAFTEMSLSIGEAFLSGSMLAVIEGLTALTQGVVKFVDTFGALPAIFGVLGMLAFKMGAFKIPLGEMRASLSMLRADFMLAQGASAKFGTVLTSVGTTATVFAGKLAVVKTALRGLLASTGIGIAFVALGFAMEKLIGWFDKQKRMNEKVEKSNKQLIDSYRNTEGGLESLINKQAELQAKVNNGSIKEGTDAYNEYVAVTNQLAEKMPTIVKYIDQSGLAHLKEADAIKEQLGFAKELSDLKNKQTVASYEASIKKQTDAYEKQTKKIKELNKELKILQQEDGKKKKVWDTDSKSFIEKDIDNMKKIQKTNMEIIQSEQKKAEYVQKTMTTIQNTTMAYLESDQKLKNLTDAGKTVIEDMVQANEELLRYSGKVDENGQKVENSTKKIKKNADALLELGQDLGSFMSDTYESLTKDIDDPVQLKEIKANMDNLIKALPPTFFKLESLKSVDDLKEKFQGVMEVADKIKAGGGSFDNLVGDLQAYGFSLDEAKGYVANLALEYDNAEIRQQAMTQAQNEGQESLENWVDTAIKAIDISEQLFGVGDEDVNAMKSHIENLQQLQAVYGKNAKDTEQWKASMEALSLFTGIPDDIIAKDLGYYKNVLDLMGKVELQYDENTGALIGFNKEGLNDKQVQMLNKMIDLGKNHGATIDLVTGKMYDLKTGVELVFNKEGELVKKISEGVKTTTAEIDEMKQKRLFNESDTSDEVVKSKTDKVKKSLQEVQASIDENKQRRLFNEVDTSGDVVKGKTDEVKKSIEEVKTTAQNMKMERIFNEGDSSPTTTKTKVDEVGKSVDAVKKKFYEFKQQKLFEGMDAGGDATLGKVDALTQAIQKASSSTALLNTLNGIIGDSTTKVNGLLDSLKNVTAGMDNVSNKTGALNTAKTAIAEMATALLGIQERVGGVFNGLAQSAGALASPVATAKNLINQIGVSVELTKTKVIGLNIVLSSLGGVSTGGLSEWVRVLGLLSHNLVSASQYGQQTVSVQSMVTASFMQAVSVAKIYSSSVIQVGTSYAVLASIIGVAVNTMIGYYAKNIQGLSLMASLTRALLSNVVTSFSVASQLIGQKVSSMASTMYREFARGVSVIVQTASGMPRRVADAIRNNMGYVVSAMRSMANVVGNTRLQPKVSAPRVSGYQGYANGGIVDKMELAWHGEEGAEAIIPLIPKRRKRGLELWKEAGSRLGIPLELLDYLKTKAPRGKGGVASDSGGSFGASSGEGGGEGGGGDSGSSGIMRESIYAGSTNIDGGYSFTTLEKADPVSINWNERRLTEYGGTLGQLEGQMERMNKSTAGYRDKLKQVLQLQNLILATTQKELKATQSRQKEIANRLKKLKDTDLTKQTEKEREEYNKLQQEYESNLQKIASLKGEVESLTNDIKAKSLEVFTDFIDEIVGKYDKAMSAIESRVDDMDFKIDVLELTNPDDKRALLNAQGDKVKALKSQQGTSQEKVDALQAEYDKVGKSKGYSSDEAKKVKEELDKAKEEYEDYTIAVLQAEKDIKDTRAEIADEAIKELKDYHTKKKDMAIEAIDLEKKALEEAHDAKMELYDEEVEKINSVYDEKIKSMDKEKSQAEYQEQLDEKNAKKAELLNKISLLSRDTSLEGKKKLAELQKELSDVNEDIADFQKERQDELLRQSLDEQKQAQLDAVAKEKESVEEQHEAKIGELDSQQEAINKQYEDLMNNDKYWAEMREQAIQGNFNTLTMELAKMKLNLNLMNRGIFDTLFQGFSGLSEEVKKQVAELNELEVDNMIYNSAEPINNVGEAMSTTGGKQKPVKRKSGSTSAKILSKKLATKTGILKLDKGEMMSRSDDILDKDSLISKMKGVLPNISIANIKERLATASQMTSNVSYGDINVTVENGDKKKAGDIASEIMKGLKKRGK